MRPSVVAPADGGLYVHVPFCLTRCGYCDFNAYAGMSHLGPAYAEALRREADLLAKAWDGVRFVSIYLGGGTPTTLPPESLGDLVAAFRDRFDVAEDAEVTCEANPDTVDRSYLERLRAVGISRLSMGVQSFDPAVLASLGRIHSAGSARRAFADARAAGFGDVNLDFIYGALGETPESWNATLEEAIDLRPDHLSCYALTVEPGTPLGQRVGAGRIPAPDPDLQADLYEASCDRLTAAGFEHYEVSNWARPGHESRHNLGYWEGRPYLGLGAGAHSYREGRRWWNVRLPQRYLDEVAAGRLPVEGEEHPDPEQAGLERVLLSIRLARGIPESWVPAAVAQAYVAGGLARRQGGRFALTDRGMLLANDLVLALEPRDC
ncbi:MAG: radical SAM family heme chaperone HemW [Actinomycetota bacterium]